MPNTVLGQLDVRLAEPTTLDWDVAISVPDTKGRAESVFYPAGTLRTLDDPIFDPSFSTLGMYDPASFLEQMAELFCQIFLSGKVYESSGMPIIIVAHSMGGLIVRETINKYEGWPRENKVYLLVTMATPFGGHSAAAKGEENGLIVLPSWRDLNPNNDFIHNLYRKPLPEFVKHELIYAYQNSSAIKLGENSDGVVALASQLRPEAQTQATGQFGFDSSHTDILDSEEVAAHLQSLIAQVENPAPAPQFEVLNQGGFEVALSDAYSPKAQYMIHNVGIYLMALTEGRFQPFYDDEERFMAVVN